MESDQENSNPFHRHSNIKSHIFKIGFAITHSQEILFRSKLKKKTILRPFLRCCKGIQGKICVRKS